MKKGLLVIDVQGYFLERTPANLPAKIRDHIKSHDYACIAFSIFQNTENSNWVRSLHWRKSQSNEDIKLAPELQEFVSSENLFIKTAYSAFHDTKLDSFLKQRGIEAVDICGIDTDACVLATAFEAFDNGYSVEVLFDLSYSRWNLDEAAKSIIMKNFYTRD
ncbi:MAG TPA: isochorismatase family cysteine hydrolase [Candidatus Saccharimonadales bacterium]|nr:isochorismatase family cysteine hydrolase [Candidatus Saccharimonadales bacterium]